MDTVIAAGDVESSAAYRDVSVGVQCVVGAVGGYSAVGYRDGVPRLESLHAFRRVPLGVSHAAEIKSAVPFV